MTYAINPSEIVSELKRQDLNPKDFEKWLKVYEKLVTQGIKQIAIAKAGSPHVEECVSKTQAYLAGSECWMEFVGMFLEEMEVENNLTDNSQEII